MFPGDITSWDCVLGSELKITKNPFGKIKVNYKKLSIYVMSFYITFSCIF